MRKSSILLLLLLLLPMVMVAQDRINLMNGQIVEAKVLGQSSLEVRYQVRKKDRLIERYGTHRWRVQRNGQPGP